MHCHPPTLHLAHQLGIHSECIQNLPRSNPTGNGCNLVTAGHLNGICTLYVWNLYRTLLTLKLIYPSEKSHSVKPPISKVPLMFRLDYSMVLEILGSTVSSASPPCPLDGLWGYIPLTQQREYKKKKITLEVRTRKCASIYRWMQPWGSCQLDFRKQQLQVSSGHCLLSLLPSSLWSAKPCHPWNMAGQVDCAFPPFLIAIF